MWNLVHQPAVHLSEAARMRRLNVLALFDKPDALEGPFFEETIYVTPSRLSALQQDEIVAATRRAVAALGLRHGPIHAELRVNDAGAWVIEVAARSIGGLCSRTLRFGAGIRLEEGKRSGSGPGLHGGVPGRGEPGAGRTPA